MKNMRKAFPKKEIWCLRPNTLRKVADMRANLRNALGGPTSVWRIIDMKIHMIIFREEYKL